ncbi:DUF3885 domain-containing protein [Streptomyces sp. NPDC001939]
MARALTERTDAARVHHPYGGVDVFLATFEEWDPMCDRHGDWLSRHPSGL